LLRSLQNLQDELVSDPFIEVIGNVHDSSTVNMLSCIGMGTYIGEPISSHRPC
jgi:hypothetical protein